MKVYYSSQTYQVILIWSISDGNHQDQGNGKCWLREEDLAFYTSIQNRLISEQRKICMARKQKLTRWQGWQSPGALQQSRVAPEHAIHCHGHRWSRLLLSKSPTSPTQGSQSLSWMQISSRLHCCWHGSYSYFRNRNLNAFKLYHLQVETYTTIL